MKTVYESRCICRRCKNLPGFKGQVGLIREELSRIKSRKPDSRRTRSDQVTKTWSMENSVGSGQVGLIRERFGWIRLHEDDSHASIVHASVTQASSTRAKTSEGQGHDDDSHHEQVHGNASEAS